MGFPQRLSVATGAVGLNFKALNIFPDSAGAVTPLPMDQLKSRYYLRVTARDLPGVMSQITHALGQQGISLSAIRIPAARSEDRVVVSGTEKFSGFNSGRTSSCAISEMSSPSFSPA